MSRKDYELIAKTIRELPETGNRWRPWDKQELAECFAKSLAETNPRFDGQRFIEACTK